MATTMLAAQPVLQAAAQTAPATQSATRTVSVPAGALTPALNRLATQTGLQILFDAGLARGKTTAGARGTMTSGAALSAVLAGTGLSARFTGPNAVTIGGPSVAVGSMPEDAIELDTVTVSGGRVAPAEAPYQTAAPVAYISQETIDRFRGSSPADIFRGTPGVMSGEARNGAGSIDVNVRGMQGMGRVAVTIDGAENGLTVYQGYQGISNRTFVDPDLLAGVEITKGSDAGSRGIAGTVAMRTLSAADVVKPGDTWGVWVKSGFGTNTTTPTPGDLGGYSWPQPYVSDPQPYPVPTASASGLDRPGALVPTSGSFSTVAAIKQADYDVLWGYAVRKQGNYFAGKNGPGAQVIDTGPQPLCYSSGFCYPIGSPISYAHVYKNGGLSSYRAGEEVLNTQLETQSLIAKATARFDGGHSVQVGYNGFRSEAGDLLASLFATDRSQVVQQVQTSGTTVDTGTVRYRWTPYENGLVDLRANLWTTKLQLRNSPRATINTKPEDLGLPYGYRTGNDTRMWGGDVTNRSHLDLDRFGSLDVTAGTTYLRESTSPTVASDQLNNIPSRNGNRTEVAGFGKLAYKPLDWLTLNGGLRYTHFWSNDLGNPTSSYQKNPEPSRDAGGYSPSVGVTVEPWKGTQLYVNYSNALRMPSLIETVSAYTLLVNANIEPERASNWEAGVNVLRQDVLAAGDKAMAKLGWFDWDIKNYVARQYGTYTNSWGGTSTALQIFNIDRAKFSGLELQGRYEYRGFTAELAANYYLDVEFCPTANTCGNSTLSADYATNQVPPEYSASLTVSQKFLDDTLTVGGRASYTGPRAAGHGTPVSGLSTLIALIDWDPYWLVDVFAEYKLTPEITAWASAENVLDRYYVDPLSLVQQPGPGRTVRVGLTGKFGGTEAPTSAAFLQPFRIAEAPGSWSGLHVGVHGGYAFASLGGSMTTLAGTTTGHTAAETPDSSPKGALFGIQAGWDHQFANRIVAGLEVDLAKPEIGASEVDYAREGATGPYSQNLYRTRQFEAVRVSEIDWLSTVRARLGYAVNDRLMAYATGGAAFMRHTEERTQYAVTSTSATQTAAAFTESAAATRVGWVLGAGLDYKVGGHWSVNAEVLLAHFGETEMTFPNARAGVMTTNNWGYPVTYSQTDGRRLLSEVDIATAKLGVNYRF
ncbi:TonB-dependent receptor [Rhodoplanes sp. TEM]|uniref:TonB-dependent receptor n=2 Tax=Rhodoplanes TaxID=29407 RepID=A0ABT5JIB4_RHOTP|nr:TonB-dependent receptor [Rhodoplanes tepidamans]MDC7789430.1 TonB-dependent receptor [Rhodoplanes tepidamans]MDC7987058.1 TonB-dependent receptor [Rhodoplanes sp. TEM]MDQ0353603.1 hemoglobin/transferrin/lactoferrin receptor protein [Rhodoplanes tepidamans]